MPVDPGRPNTADWGDPVVLIAGVDQPRVDFAETTESGGAWRDDWAPSATIPAAVRLSFLIRGRSIVIDVPIYADPIRDCRLPAQDLACPQLDQPSPDQPAEQVPAPEL